MADILSQVGIKVTADTKQAVEAFRQMEGAQKKCGEASAFIQKISVTLDKAMVPLLGIQTGFMAVNVAMELGGKVASALGAAYRFLTGETDDAAKAAASYAAESEKLQKWQREHAVAMDDLTIKMRVTSGGFDSLRHSAEEAAERGIGTATDNFKEMIDAISKGDADALRKFGVNMSFTGDAAADAARAINLLSSASDDYNKLLSRQSVELNQFLMLERNAAGDAARAFFEYAQALERAGGAHKVFMRDGGIVQVGVSPSENLSQRMGESEEKYAARLSEADVVGIVGSLGKSAPSAIRKRYDDIMRKRRGSGGGAGAGYKLAFATPIEPNWDALMQAAINPWEAERQAYATGRGESPGGGPASAMVSPGQTGVESEQRAAEERAKRYEKILSDLQDRTRASGAAYGAMSDGIAASVDAAITGSESIGKAMARAAAASLKATATEAAVKALWETAQGTAALALGPVGGVSAAAHFKAAGIYAATAVAAGVGASALGSASGAWGGGGAGGSTSAGGGYIGPRQTGDGGTSVTVIVQGDVYDGDALAEKVERATRRAVASGRVRGGSSGQMVERV